jgi:hypothetical protein
MARFIDAVRFWAETTGNKYKIPRKGTAEYTEVMGFLDELKKIEAGDAKPKKASKMSAPRASAAAPAPAPMSAPKMSKADKALARAEAKFQEGRLRAIAKDKAEAAAPKKKKKIRIAKEEFVEPELAMISREADRRKIAESRRLREAVDIDIKKARDAGERLDRAIKDSRALRATLTATLDEDFFAPARASAAAPAPAPAPAEGKQDLYIELAMYMEDAIRRIVGDEMDDEDYDRNYAEASWFDENVPKRVRKVFKNLIDDGFSFKSIRKALLERYDGVYGFDDVVKFVKAMKK